MRRPYYERSGVTLYHGDAREIVPEVGADSIITDPVWPNATAFPGVDAQSLLRDVLAQVDADAVRLGLILGCDSDPRFLTAVPQRWAFFRTARAEYNQPSYKGRILNEHEAIYLFGLPPPSRDGMHLIPGHVRATYSKYDHRTKHPTPRKLAHMRWIVKWWSAPSDVILDPFTGSGTTLEAARAAGRKAIGVEIEERWCEAAALRLSQLALDMPE